MATIKDVARMAGVSTATVSATLNHSAYVSPSLQARVRKAVETLSFAPSTLARSLKMGRTNMLGLVVCDITNSFFSALVQAVEATAHRQGYTVLLGHSDESGDKEVELLRLMLAQHVDGVILAPVGRQSDYEAAGLLPYRIPLVLVDRIVDGFEADAVAIDNRKAACTATRYLIERGHRMIATVAGPEVTTGTDRLAGYRAALEAAGIAFDPRYVIRGSYRQDEGQSAIRQLMGLPEPPTAVFVANSQMLIGAMRGLAQLGLQCPDDVSIIAMDDMPWMSAFSPKMTVFRQPIHEMGDRVMELMLQRLGGHGSAPPRRLVLESTLIERDSVRPAASALAMRSRKVG